MMYLPNDITPCCRKPMIEMRNVRDKNHKIIVCPKCLKKYDEKIDREYITTVIIYEYITTIIL